MAVSKLDVFEQYFDDDGFLAAGCKIHTYAAGTSTPLATYTDATGTVANSNPIVGDASARVQTWFTRGVSYKLVLTDADDVTLETIDGLSIPDDASALALSLGIDFIYHGASPPSASEWLGGYSFPVAVTFPINLSGAFGHINTNPTASFAIDLRKNATSTATGTSVGTVTIATGGTYTFASAAAAEVSFDIGDHLSAWAPSSADSTANDFNFTLLGTVG